MNYDCFVVDDEESIAQTICEYFNMFDINTCYKTSYSEGIQFLKENQVSLILLDINLGTDSGFLFCKELRQTSDTPVIFISARSSDDDILSALSIGGDDYITKPFSLNILMAKVNAMLRRRTKTESESSALPDQQQNETISVANIEIERNTQRVYKSGEPVKLKPMEYKLLLFFLENRNRVITKDELLNEVWNNLYLGEGTLSVHIRHLREKLEDNPNEPKLIKTIWGTGYLFEAER